MHFVVLEVGGPGFSSVPYGKKGEKAANQLPLYTRTPEGGHTLFHTFKKVESNLERGPRSTTEEGDNGPVDLACTLAPGLSLSMYIRPENFKGNVFYNGRLEGGDRSKPSELQYVKLSEGSPYWQTDVIPENTVVFVQVGVCNAEQALKGSMLKVKKIMPADAPGALGLALEAMPRSLQAFEDNMQSHKDKFPGLQRSLYAGNSRLMAGEPDKHAYCNHDEATASFVICDFGAGISEVHVAEALVSKAFCCSDKAVCQKMLDVAIAARAIQVCACMPTLCKRWLCHQECSIAMHRALHRALHRAVECAMHCAPYSWPAVLAMYRAPQSWAGLLARHCSRLRTGAMSLLWNARPIVRLRGRSLSVVLLRTRRHRLIAYVRVRVMLVVMNGRTRSIYHYPPVTYDCPRLDHCPGLILVVLNLRTRHHVTPLMTLHRQHYVSLTYHFHPLIVV